MHWASLTLLVASVAARELTPIAEDNQAAVAGEDRDGKCKKPVKILLNY